MGLELEFTEGMQFDKGYISPYFVTDPERMEAVLEDAYVLINQGKISSISDLLPLLEKVAQAGKPLLVIAEDVDGEALSTLVVNKIRGTLQRRSRSRPRASATAARPCSQDIAILTGAPGRRRRGRPQAGPGRPRGARHRPPHHRHQGRHHDRRRRRRHDRRSQDRIRQIQAEIEDTDSDWDREKLQERLAKLAGGVCVIRVGAATEVELKEKKHRLEDAISATRAAIEEGIVAGGGSALVHAAAGARRRLGLTGDEATGVAIVRKALGRAAALDRRERRPRGLRRDRTRSRTSPAGHGLNAATGEYGDLIAAGVIDPVKVTRSALPNAASIAAHAADHRDPGRREAGEGRSWYCFESSILVTAAK